MIVYLNIDEAGDPGLDLQKSGTSKIFLITALISNEQSQKIIHKTVRRLLKNKINHKKKSRNIEHELKGATATDKVKLYFYNQLNEIKNWSLYAVLIKKEKLFLNKTKPYLPHVLYNDMVIRLLNEIDLFKTVTRIELSLDRCKSKKEIKIFDKQAMQVFKTRFGSNITIFIDHQRSIDNPVLQAADMFAWGIFSKYERNDDKWYKLFQEKIKLLQLY